MGIQRIVIVIDGPNYYYMNKSLGVNINFRELFYLISGKNVEIPICKIFYDQVPGHRNTNLFYQAMAEIGFELVPVPMHQYGTNGRMVGKNYKSRTDQMITIHLMKHLLNDEFDKLIFFTGDSDYKFLLDEIKKSGKLIDIYATSGNISGSLMDVADKVIKLDELEKDSKLLMPQRHRVGESPNDAAP